MSSYGGGNSAASNSGYGHQAADSSNAAGNAGLSTQYGGSRLGGQTDISKNGQSRFSRLAQFGMGGGGGAPADLPAPTGGRHGGVQPLSSGYGTNNSTSIGGAGAAHGRHKF